MRCLGSSRSESCSWCQRMSPRRERVAAVPNGVAEGEEYRIGPEDALQIFVWKNETLSRVVSVRPDGKISLPLLGDVQAAGQTPRELRDTLVTRYTEFIAAPEISVIVNEVKSIKVSVIGEVPKPGRFELKSRTTGLDMLALAGFWPVRVPRPGRHPASGRREDEAHPVQLQQGGVRGRRAGELLPAAGRHRRGAVGREAGKWLHRQKGISPGRGTSHAGAGPWPWPCSWCPCRPSPGSRSRCRGCTGPRPLCSSIASRSRRRSSGRP